MVRVRTPSQLRRYSRSDFERSPPGYQPAPMTAFTIAAISMVGLPPTAGFSSKWYLVSGAVETNRWVPVIIVAGAILLLGIASTRVISGVL